MQKGMHVKAPVVVPEGGFFELKDRKSSHQTTVKESQLLSKILNNNRPTLQGMLRPKSKKHVPISPNIIVEKLEQQVDLPESKTMIGDPLLSESIISNPSLLLDKPPSAEGGVELVIDDFSASLEKPARQQVVLEGNCYLKTKSERFKKHWAILTGNELFCYQKKEDTTYFLMHSLAGTFVKEMAEEVLHS